MVKLQSSLPFIFAGLDVAIVLAVIGAIVGEFIGAQAGLGYLLLQRNFSMDTAGSFAILIVLSAIGMILHQLMASIRKRVVFWTEREATLASETM
jgi:NitT/TauT family transport system permease protein